MTWSIVGLTLSLAVALLAWRRMRAPGGFYDRDVYGMTTQAHRRYLGIEAALSVVFLGTLITRFDRAAVWVLALAVLVDLFYLTSFLRGASEEE